MNVLPINRIIRVFFLSLERCVTLNITTMADQLNEKWFATYPFVPLQDIVVKTVKKTEGKGKNKKVVEEREERKLQFVKQLLFGDYIQVCVEDGAYVTETLDGVEYVKVHCRNADGYLRWDQMQKERPVEVNFIDVGQGDGCHIVTSDDKHFLVDAGKGSNMYRFLKWRFNLRSPKNKAPGFTVVITHSDEDHYKGFKDLFEKAKPKETQEGASEGEENTPQIRIKKIYHNGIVEGSGKVAEALGTVVTQGGKTYITDLCDTDADYKKRVQDLESGLVKDKDGDVIPIGKYIEMLKLTDAPKTALRAGTEDKPVYLYNKNGTTMEIMGPIAEEIDGKPALPYFGSTGKTKNGHSVIIKLTVGHLRLLLGGDLNMEAENYLLKKYSGKDVQAIVKDLKKKLKPAARTTKETELEEAIQDAQKYLKVDIAKSCHHGSDEFTSEFLRVLNPLATVISSGDEESYCHPRPDTLGTIGKYSRGHRPMIFSTELARSGKEFLKLDKLDLSSQKKNERVVTVYGMINVRTDGNRVIFAQKLEQKATNGYTWDIHKLEWNEEKGDFELVGAKE